MCVLFGAHVIVASVVANQREEPCQSIGIVAVIDGDQDGIVTNVIQPKDQGCWCCEAALGVVDKVGLGIGKGSSFGSSWHFEL